MPGEEGKILRNFGSETKVKKKSSYQGCIGRLERTEESEKGGETEQDRMLGVLLGEERNSGV